MRRLTELIDQCEQLMCRKWPSVLVHVVREVYRKGKLNETKRPETKECYGDLQFFLCRPNPFCPLLPLHESATERGKERETAGQEARYKEV